MEYMEIIQEFKRLHNHTDEFMKFERVTQKFDVGFPINHQLYSFILLGSIFPTLHKIIISTDFDTLCFGSISWVISILTPELILDLVRCGVYLCEDLLCMQVDPPPSISIFS